LNIFFSIAVMRDIEAENLKKKRVARLSIFSNTFLVFMKLGAGLAVGSISMISEAVHSAVDLVAAGIAYLSVKKSAVPPDDCHEYGHGKFEDISGIVEAILIVVASMVILYEAVMSLVGGHEMASGELLTVGIIVMLISTLMNFYVSSKLFSVAKETGSIALESDAWHLRTDVFTSAGVMFGLILIKITGFGGFDAIIAIGISFVILHAAYDLIKRSFGHLTDRSLPEDDMEEILEILKRFCGNDVNFHDIRSRRAGPDRFVEFHLTVPGDLSVSNSHELTDRIEAALKSKLGRIFVTIHVEPSKNKKD
jgi:cation diffusion facilitator family transporter